LEQQCTARETLEKILNASEAGLVEILKGQKRAKAELQATLEELEKKQTARHVLEEELRSMEERLILLVEEQKHA
jgi:arsenate reductase-like glutaredoxin family protein